MLPVIKSHITMVKNITDWFKWDQVSKSNWIELKVEKEFAIIAPELLYFTFREHRRGAKRLEL